MEWCFTRDVSFPVGHVSCCHGNNKNLRNLRRPIDTDTGEMMQKRDIRLNSSEQILPGLREKKTKRGVLDHGTQT